MPTWRPGQSGNPSGRPKLAWQVREKAKQHAMACLDRFIKEASNEDPKIALPACKEVLRMAGVSFDSEKSEEVIRTVREMFQPKPEPQLVAALTTTDAPPLN